MFLSILIASVLEGVSYLYTAPSGIVNVSNNSKWFHLAFPIKTTHLREPQLSLPFGTTVHFVGVNNFGSGKVGIVRDCYSSGCPWVCPSSTPNFVWMEKQWFWLFLPELWTACLEPVVPTGLDWDCREIEVTIPPPTPPLFLTRPRFQSSHLSDSFVSKNAHARLKLNFYGAHALDIQPPQGGSKYKINQSTACSVWCKAKEKQ